MLHVGATDSLGGSNQLLPWCGGTSNQGGKSDHYLERCRVEGIEPVSWRDFERHRG